MTTPWDAVMAAVTRLGDRVDAMPSVREATVSSTDPLSVLFDTDSVATLVTGSLQEVFAGDRVLTLRLKRYIWVLGSRNRGSDSPGDIKMTAAAVAPPGWMLAQGQSLLRADYPRLFAAIGTQFGAADSTHFNVPNLKGRMPVGIDTGQTEFDTRGETGGAKSVTLTAAQSGLPAHTHTPNSTGSYVLANGSGGPGGTANVTTGGGGYVQTTLNNNAASNASQAHQNLPPYLALHFIIKL